MTAVLKSEEQVREVEQQEQVPAVHNVQYQHASYDEALGSDEAARPEEAAKAAPFVRRMDKVGRNDPCPCGSGKKYKHCHGKLS